MVDKNYALKYGEIISKCWQDETYKQKFMQDTESVLTEAGIAVEEGIDYKVIEAPKMVQYIVLPREDTQTAVQSLVKRFLNKAIETNKIVPPGVEIRIIQNTEDTDYLILPASPKSLTTAELANVSGGGAVLVTGEVVQIGPVVPVVQIEPVGPVVVQLGSVVIGGGVAAALVLI